MNNYQANRFPPSPFSQSGPRPSLNVPPNFALPLPSQNFNRPPPSFPGGPRFGPTNNGIQSSSQSNGGHNRFNNGWMNGPPPISPQSRPPTFQQNNLFNSPGPVNNSFPFKNALAAPRQAHNSFLSNQSLHTSRTPNITNSQRSPHTNNSPNTSFPPPNFNTPPPIHNSPRVPTPSTSPSLQAPHKNALNQNLPHSSALRNNFPNNQNLSAPPFPQHNQNNPRLPFSPNNLPPNQNTPRPLFSQNRNPQFQCNTSQPRPMLGQPSVNTPGHTPPSFNHHSAGGSRGRGGMQRGRGGWNNNRGGRGAFNNNRNNNQGNKKEKVDKRELPENNAFYCDTCDRGFKTKEKYEEHVGQHQKCKFKDCPFIAAPKLVALHVNMQHRNGLAKKVYSLESEEDIKKWREERKRKFPTTENIQKKKEEQAEKIARGEVLETKNFSAIRGGRGRERGRGRDRGRGRGRGRERRFNPSEDFIEAKPSAASDSDSDAPPEETKIEKVAMEVEEKKIAVEVEVKKEVVDGEGLNGDLRDKMGKEKGDEEEGKVLNNGGTDKDESEEKKEEKDKVAMDDVIVMEDVIEYIDLTSDTEETDVDSTQPKPSSERTQTSVLESGSPNNNSLGLLSAYGFSSSSDEDDDGDENIVNNNHKHDEDEATPCKRPRLSLNPSSSSASVVVVNPAPAVSSLPKSIPLTVSTADSREDVDSTVNMNRSSNVSIVVGNSSNSKNSHKVDDAEGPESSSISGQKKNVVESCDSNKGSTDKEKQNCAEEREEGECEEENTKKDKEEGQGASAAADKGWKRPNRRNKNKQNKHQEKKSGKLPSYTLLEKLLAPEICRERNKILQCVHYIVKNKFFDKTASP